MLMIEATAISFKYILARVNISTDNQSIFACVMSVIEKLTEFLNMLTMNYELRYKCWINTVAMVYLWLIVFVDYSTFQNDIRSLF